MLRPASKEMLDESCCALFQSKNTALCVVMSCPACHKARPLHEVYAGTLELRSIVAEVGVDVLPGMPRHVSFASGVAEELCLAAGDDAVARMPNHVTFALVGEVDNVLISGVGSGSTVVCTDAFAGRPLQVGFVGGYVIFEVDFAFRENICACLPSHLSCVCMLYRECDGAIWISSYDVAFVSIPNHRTAFL